MKKLLICSAFETGHGLVELLWTSKRGGIRNYFLLGFATRSQIVLREGDVFSVSNRKLLLTMTASSGELRRVLQDKGSLCQANFDITLSRRQKKQTEI